MYLFLGGGHVVGFCDIVGVFDLDTASVGAVTRSYLAAAQKAGRVVDVTPGQLPKSFVVCEREDKAVVYLSQISSATLKKRFLGGFLDDRE